MLKAKSLCCMKKRLFMYYQPFMLWYTRIPHEDFVFKLFIDQISVISPNCCYWISSRIVLKYPGQITCFTEVWDATLYCLISVYFCSPASLWNVTKSFCNLTVSISDCWYIHWYHSLYNAVPKWPLESCWMVCDVICILLWCHHQYMSQDDVFISSTSRSLTLL